MRILFVVPKIKSLFGDKGATVHPHIGIAYLSAFLKSRGIEIAIFDAGIEPRPEKVFTILNEFKPDLIGITIFSYCYDAAYELIKIIKINSNVPLALGGPHVCAVGKKILKDTQVEFAIKQEGEFTLLELLAELKKNNPDFSRIKGLVWRDKTEGIIENPDRDLIADLDKLPFPDYETFGIEKYPCYKLKAVPLITSRGCPFGCNYCSVRLSMGQRFRPRSPENVFAEIKHFYDRGFSNFDINDDCFTLDSLRAEAICDLIIGNKLKIKFQLYNGIRVDAISLGLLKKMKQAGCFFISYGCEAGNERVLGLIKKGVTREQVRAAVNWTNEAGIHNAVNFIIGHKEETYAEALDTIDFAKSLPTDFANFYNLLPYPGTESFEWAKQHATFLVPQDSFLESISYRDNIPIYETKEFTKEQRERVIALGFDLYKKKILTFRLGRILGNLIYWITGFGAVNKFATNFALNNPVGKSIYMRLSKKSFMAKENRVGLGAN